MTAGSPFSLPPRLPFTNLIPKPPKSEIECRMLCIYTEHAHMAISLKYLR